MPPVRLLPLLNRLDEVPVGIAADVSARTTVVPAWTPEAIWTLVDPTTPSLTWAVDVLLSDASTVTVPVAVPVRVTADTGTTTALSAEATVMTAVAVVPAVRPVLGASTTMVTG